MPTKPKKKSKDKKAESPKKTSVPKGSKRVKTPAMIENPGGRPSEFDEAAPKIIASIRGGSTYKCASACARVSYLTFNLWMNKGREAFKNGELDSKYLKFLNDVEQAEAEIQQDCVRAWQTFVPMNWQAARDFLARRNPDEWGSKDRVDVTSNGETVGKQFFLPMKDDEPE